MLKNLTAIILASVLAGSAMMMPQAANALSCLPPDIQASYKKWSNSDKNFVIIRGYLKPIGKLPPRKLDRQLMIKHPKKMKSVRYRFSGVNIRADGNSKFSAELTVTPRCLGPWCGPYPNPTGQVVTAIELTSSGKYVMNTSPCPGDFFTGDMPQLEQSIRNCMKGVSCSPENRPRKPQPKKKPSVTLKLK